MLSETKRPEHFSEILGHQEAKKSLETYLKSDFKGAVFLLGSPGIGKTTLALCSAKTFEFDPLEINASKLLRSFDDVENLKNSCQSSVNIQSFIRGDVTKKTCLILDEIDGSDPHAQLKIIDWIKDTQRKVPILLTGNELPIIFKKNSNIVEIIRCFPPSSDLLKKLSLFIIFIFIFLYLIKKNTQNLIEKNKKKENEDGILILLCTGIIGTALWFFRFPTYRYGSSYIIPLYFLPPTGSPPEMIFLWKQKMFDLEDPLEYLYDKLDNVHLHQTKFECKFDEKNVGKRVGAHRQKKCHPDI